MRTRTLTFTEGELNFFRAAVRGQKTLVKTALDTVANAASASDRALLDRLARLEEKLGPPVILTREECDEELGIR